MDANQREEEATIKQAISGDKFAFGQLFDIYYSLIFGYLRSRTQNIQDAEDLTEIVFLSAWKNLPNLRQKNGRYQFKAWLFRIAHNKLIDYYRRDRQEESFNGDFFHNLSDRETEARALAADNETRLQNAIGKLERRMQDVLTARFILGLSHLETAEMLGISTGNVRVIQFRALRKLKEFMREEDERI